MNFKKITSLFLASVISLSAIPAVHAAPASSQPNKIPSTYELVCENDGLALYSEYSTGKIAVANKESGFNWFSNPLDAENENLAGGEIRKRLDSQIVMYYTQGFSEAIASSATGVVNRKGLSHTKLKNGLRFDYKFSNIGYTIPVTYTLEEDGLLAKVLISEITPKVVTRQESVSGSKEKHDVDYNITKIDFLQYFGSGSTNVDGYMFIPEGSGAIINYNNGKQNYASYSAPVYGQYMDIPSMSTLSNDLVRLPVFGVQRDDNAFVAIIQENESMGYINATVSGRDTTFNTVYSSVQDKIIDFSVGENRTQPLSESLTTHGDYAVKYYFLSGEDANYSGMAKTYRNYLIEEKGLKKSESADTSPLYLELYSGVERKTSVFGFVRYVLDVLCSYDDVIEIADSYISNGVSDLVIKYNDWNKKSDRKKVKTKVTYESKLGGRSDFNELLEYTEANNISFYPSVNFVEYSKSRLGYSSIFDATKQPNQSPAYQYPALRVEGAFGKRWSFLKPNKLEALSEKYITSYTNAGLDSIALENLGNIVYSDNTKGGVKRSQTVEAWERILKNYDENVGDVMLSNANAYALPFAEHIIAAPLNEYGNELSDETIPFYQMVIHGYTSYSTPSINLVGDWRESVLKAVETGSALSYTLVKQNSDVLMDSYLNRLYSCDYDIWYGRTIADYESVKDVMTKTAGHVMTGHQKLADEVYMTSYENGVNVIVNYNSEEVTTDYGTVGGMSFIISE